MEQLKARNTGEFHALDIAPAVTRALTKLSAFRWRHFIPELSQVPFPNMRFGHGQIEFAPANAEVRTIPIDCDRAALESPFQAGKRLAYRSLARNRLKDRLLRRQ